MKWIAKIETPEPMNFVIEYDESAGYYLYVYKNNINIVDYLQDTLELAQEQALEEFGVPFDAWKKEN